MTAVLEDRHGLRLNPWPAAWDGCLPSDEADRAPVSYTQTLLALWRLENELSSLEAGCPVPSQAAGQRPDRPASDYPDLRRLLCHLDCRPLIRAVNTALARDPSPALEVIAADQIRRLEIVETSTAAGRDRVDSQALKMSIDAAVSYANWVLDHKNPADQSDIRPARHWLTLIADGVDPALAWETVIETYQLTPGEQHAAQLTELHLAAEQVNGGWIDPTPAMYCAVSQTESAGRVYDDVREALILHGAVARNGQHIYGILPKAVIAWLERPQNTSAASRVDALRTDPATVTGWTRESWDTALTLWPEFGHGAAAAERAIEAAFHL